jgi:hypothetical protein
MSECRRNAALPYIPFGFHRPRSAQKAEPDDYQDESHFWSTSKNSVAYEMTISATACFYLAKTSQGEP